MVLVREGSLETLSRAVPGNPKGGSQFGENVGWNWVKRLQTSIVNSRFNEPRAEWDKGKYLYW